MNASQSKTVVTLKVLTVILVIGAIISVAGAVGAFEPKSKQEITVSCYLPDRTVHFGPSVFEEPSPVKSAGSSSTGTWVRLHSGDVFTFSVAVPCEVRRSR